MLAVEAGDRAPREGGVGAEAALSVVYGFVVRRAE